MWMVLRLCVINIRLPVTGVLKGGLESIKDDELDIESIEKGLEENAALELSKPFTWINMLNTDWFDCSNDWSSWYSYRYDWSV